MGRLWRGNIIFSLISWVVCVIFNKIAWKTYQGDERAPRFLIVLVMALRHKQTTQFICKNINFSRFEASEATYVRIQVWAIDPNSGFFKRQRMSNVTHLLGLNQSHVFYRPKISIQHWANQNIYWMITQTKHKITSLADKNLIKDFLFLT